MSKILPLRANLEWLRALAKDRLATECSRNPRAKLSEVQFALAREYGFASWRRLKARVDDLRHALDAVVPKAPGAQAAAASVASDDPDLARLMAAIQAGDQGTVAQVLSARRELAGARDGSGQSPMHAAAEANDPRLAAYLAAMGADVDARYGDWGHTPLSWAITCRALECAATLVRLGARLDVFCAAGMGDVDALREFFDASGALRPGAARTGSSRYDRDGKLLPCPPETDVERISDALYIASRNAQAAAVRLLLEKRPDLDFRGYMGGTALHWAHFGGSREVIALLEEAGADPAARDHVLHATPRLFGIAVPSSWGMHWKVRERLWQDPQLAKFMDGRTSGLHEAARAGHAPIVRLLLEAGASKDERDGEGRTAREIAAARGHAAVVELLVT